MAKPVSGDAPDATSTEALVAIADSVRGAFQTVEDMTQTFIREAILQGVFPPGHRLNLDMIAATLGVSRMPVRASLRQLESEGLLKINPYRSATVTMLSAEEISEIYELRIVLENFLLEHAMPNLDEDVLGRLREVVDELEAADSLGDRLDKRNTFYSELYQCAGRPRALAQVTTLRGAVGRYLLLQRVDEHPVHEEFFEHLAAGDLPGAQGLLTAHLQHVSERLQAMVQETPTAAAV